MGLTITDEARRFIAALESETGATAVDCIVDDEYDRLAFVLDPAEIGQAIGPGGRTVSALEERFDREVTLVEDAPTAEAFVANALAPAAVLNVTISENDTTVAYVEVAARDRGAAIGTDGRRIDLARTLAARHFDLDDVELA